MFKDRFFFKQLTMALFRFFNQIIAPFRAKKVKEWCEVSSSLKPPAKVTGAWSSLLLRLSEMAWAEKVAYADCTGSLLVRIKYDQFRTSPNQINYLQSRSWRYIFQKNAKKLVEETTIGSSGLMKSLRLGPSHLDPTSFGSLFCPMSPVVSLECRSLKIPQED